MPLVYVPSEAVVPPQPEPPPPPNVNPAVPVWTWTPTGRPTRRLNDSPQVGVLMGGVGSGRSIVGLDMPPEQQFDTDLAVGAGQMMNHRRFAAREFGVPIVLHADTHDELEQRRRGLIADFNPALGDGVFTVAYPGGMTRSLTARYLSGLDLADYGRMGGRSTYDSYMVVLKARDPFPFGDEQIHTFNPPDTLDFFAPPGDPNVLYISESGTTGEVDVLIDGEVEVWPVWEIDGPCTTATLTNRDTGQTLALTPNLEAGQTLIVRTDPRTPASEKITRGGVNVWVSSAGQFPVMWSLRPGVNQVTVLFSGTVAGQSQGRLRYRPRYLSA